MDEVVFISTLNEITSSVVEVETVVEPFVGVTRVATGVVGVCVSGVGVSDVACLQETNARERIAVNANSNDLIEFFMGLPS